MRLELTREIARGAFRRLREDRAAQVTLAAILGGRDSECWGRTEWRQQDVGSVTW